MYNISLSNNTLYIRPNNKEYNECKFLKVDYLGDYGETVMVEESVYDELKNLDKHKISKQVTPIVNKYWLEQFGHLPKGF